MSYHGTSPLRALLAAVVLLYGPASLGGCLAIVGVLNGASPIFSLFVTTNRPNQEVYAFSRLAEVL